ncbi:MAG TPA: hypothetical protein VGB99_00730 [Acidobacteriota bacterium]
MRAAYKAWWLGLWLATGAAAQEPPRPDAVVNCSDGPVALSGDAALSLVLGLEAGAAAGAPADWYLVASTPLGWYSADSTGAWIPSDPETIAPLYQGPLLDLPLTEVLYVAGLPPGSYRFYFGVDTVPNGQLDVGALSFDAVSAALATGGAPAPFPAAPGSSPLELGR